MDVNNNTPSKCNYLPLGKKKKISKFIKNAKNCQNVVPKFGEKKSDCQVPTKQNWKHKIFLKSDIWQRAAISVLKNFVGNFYIRTHQKFPILHPVIYI